MIALGMVTNSTVITALRWTARIVGGLVLITVVSIAIGECYPNPLTLKTGELVSSALMLAMILGIPVAWRWELVGGGMLVTGYVAFLAVESIARGKCAFFSFTFFDLFLLLGLLNLSVWWLAKRSRVSLDGGYNYKNVQTRRNKLANDQSTIIWDQLTRAQF